MPPKSDRKRTVSTRESSGGPAKKQQKRTRFASPGSEPAMEGAQFDEQVAATLETPSAARKGRVNTAGYESDSSDDGEGVVESRKRGAKKGGDGEDDDEDMFAMGDKEEREDEVGGKKKKDEYLRLGDIEGQEFGEGRGELSDVSSEEDEPEDEDDAERRKKAGMGWELSGFNMREEMEEGKFAADGTFVRTFDPHGVHDRWMDGLDEREIKKARRNKKIREREERARIEKEEADNALSKDDAQKELVGYLRKGETVLEALHRLGVALKKDKGKHPTTKKPPNGMDLDASRPPSTIQTTITRITDLASIIMSSGNIDIYSSQYEQLLRAVRAAGEVSPDWVPPSQETQYEYRWAAQDQQSPQVYGPYKHEEMLAWHDAKYFGEDGEMVRVRTVGENNWHEWEEVMF